VRRAGCYAPEPRWARDGSSRALALSRVRTSGREPRAPAVRKPRRHGSDSDGFSKTSAGSLNLAHDEMDFVLAFFSHRISKVATEF